VANVPEGLPTTVISILALAAERMSEHHILIKQTAIIEALGCVVTEEGAARGRLEKSWREVRSGVGAHLASRLLLSKRTLSRARPPQQEHHHHLHGQSASCGVRQQRVFTARQVPPASMDQPPRRVATLTPLAHPPYAQTGTLTMGVMTVENVWTNKSFHPAGKVKFGGAGGPRRADPAANMTVGRQMSMLRDGTMVIHSTATRGRGALAGAFTPAATQQQQGPAMAATPGVGGAPAAGASHGRLVGAPSMGLPSLAEEGGGGGGGGGGGEAEEGGPGFTPAPLVQRAGPPVAAEPVAAAAAAAAGTGAAAPAPAAPGLPQPVTLAPLHEATAIGTTTVAAATAAAPEATAVSVPQATTTTTTVAAASRRGGALGSPPPQPTPAPGAFGGHSRAAVSTGGGIDRSVSLARQSSYASFYSFQGMTGASWARSNAFTRLITIAAICNRAQFSYEEAEAAGEEEGGGSPGHEPAAATVPLRGPYRKKRGTGTATGTGGGAPASAGKTGAAPPAVEKYRGDKRRVLGDASEAALLRYVDSLVPIFEFRMVS
jgi:hypothetical protein